MLKELGSNNEKNTNIRGLKYKKNRFISKLICIKIMEIHHQLQIYEGSFAKLGVNSNKECANGLLSYVVHSLDINVAILIVNDLLEFPI